MKDRLRAAARALRNFLQGFVGTAPGLPGARTREDDGSHRPFCC